MADGYRRNRVWYQDITGNLTVTGLTGQTTLATPRGSNTLFIQRLSVVITGAVPGVTWTIQDGAGLVILASVSAAATTSQPFYNDYLSHGIRLTQNTTLVFVPSAGGASGYVEWEGYQRLLQGQAVALGAS